jgi:methylated-DNA-[protein]-cysteine S-methyltransferase
MELFIDKINSPLGIILVVADTENLYALDYADYEHRLIQLLQLRYGHFQLKETTNPAGISSQIQAYLEGNYSSLDQIPVKAGGTAFQQQVWAALRTIPPGTAVTYGELSAKLGKPTAYRAVGMANSLNPVAIVVPCHRVIGAKANLTGYAGGLERKRWLLRHEGIDLDSRN